VKLLESIRRKGYVGSVATSFSCDLPFYEQQVLQQLRAVGCTNNLLLVDARAYVDGLPAQAPLLTNAGRTYSVQPVDLDAAFHPKVFVQLGRDRGRALIGSANVSLAAWARNREVVVELAFEGLNHPARPLVAQLYVYATSFCDRAARSTAFQLSELEREAPWVLQERSEGPVTLPDGRTVALLCGPSAESFAVRFARLVEPDRVERLVALAPFWDEHGKAFTELADAVGAKTRVAIVQAATTTLSPGAAESLKPVPFDTTPERYLHAKLYVAEGEAADHLLVGSANCSVRALGTRVVAPRNAEACVYERLPAGTTLHSLSLAAIAASEDYVSPDEFGGAPTDEPGDGPRPILPGHVEREADRIRWLPAPGLSAYGAELELLDERFAPLGRWRTSDDGAWRYCEPGEHVLEAARAARVALATGVVTRPVVVHALEAIRHATPSGEVGGLRAIVQRLQLGSGDVLELLGPFQRLLFQTRDAAAPRTSRTAPASGAPLPREKQRASAHFLTYAEFIEGRGRQVVSRRALGSVERSDLAALLGFLSDRFQLADGGVEETADGADEDVLDDDEEAEAPNTPEVKPPPVPLDLDRARALLARVHADYCRWASELRGTGDAIGPDEVAQLGLLLRLSSCLAGRQLAGPTGALEPILPPQSDEMLDLLTVVVDVLGLFFVRGSSGPAPAARVIVPADQRLATEYPVTWNVCCWAVCHAMAIAEREGLMERVRGFEVIGTCAYDVTGIGRGVFDEADIIRELLRAEVASGASVPRDTLLRVHERFRELSRERAPLGWKPSKAGTAVAPGLRVWVYGAGPRYVRSVRPKVVELECPGVDGRDESPHRVALGFIVKLPAVPRYT
jgi:hypothetical protein